MRARDLVDEFPTVGLDTEATTAARLLADQDLPGLIVIDESGAPHSILPGTQVLEFMIPGYVLEHPTLARVIDEPAADVLWDALSGLSVRDLLLNRPRELPVVDHDATVLEIAAIMVRTRTPVVAVFDQAVLIGAITLDALLDRMLTREP